MKRIVKILKSISFKNKSQIISTGYETYKLNVQKKQRQEVRKRLKLQAEAVEKNNQRIQLAFDKFKGYYVDIKKIGLLNGRPITGHLTVRLGDVVEKDIEEIVADKILKYLINEEKWPKQKIWFFNVDTGLEVNLY